MKSNAKVANTQEKNAGSKGNAKSGGMSAPQPMGTFLEFCENLRSSTWRDLEVGRHFGQNEKLAFVSGKLLVGCDIGSEKHFARAISPDGVELSKKPFSFTNDEEGFKKAFTWMAVLAQQNNLDQIVLGLEPTAHYWFNFHNYMVEHGVTVVTVNPYAVKATKEIEDNSQTKSDNKDPKVIVGLVKGGNFSMPYVAEGVRAELRESQVLRDQVMSDKVREMNRLHRCLSIVFPNYKSVFGDEVDGLYALHILSAGLLPQDIVELGAEGLQELFKGSGLRRAKHDYVADIVEAAAKCGVVRAAQEGMRNGIKTHARNILRLQGELADLKGIIFELSKSIPNTDKLLAIRGIGITTMCGLVSDLGDISRFDSASEIQKLAGLGLVSASSGKHNGKTKISHRGRCRLRYWFLQAAEKLVIFDDSFNQLYHYFMTRPNNPLNKCQAKTAVACKFIRVFYKIMKDGAIYDPKKMLSDIRRQDTPASV